MDSQQPSFGGDRTCYTCGRESSYHPQFLGIVSLTNYFDYAQSPVT